MLPSSNWRNLVVMLSLALPLIFSTQATGDIVTQQIGNPGSRLDIKLQSYRDSYPEIMFLVLTGDDWIADMITLDILLGHQPMSMDYEHAPELREDLMIATSTRILKMLQQRAPSATLYRAHEPMGWPETICVLTINPAAIATDALQATRNFLGLSHELVSEMPREMRLSHADYLEYVIDHEVYHCLQSMNIGPQQMSNKELWGEYQHHLNELGADAYALAMHISENGRVTDFAVNVQRIRGTALTTSDPNHLTCRAADRVFSIAAGKFEVMDDKAIFLLAADIRKQLDPGYDAYLVFMASAVEAMKKLGVEAMLSEEAEKIIRQTEYDPDRVNELIENTKRCLDELKIKKSH